MYEGCVVLRLSAIGTLATTDEFLIDQQRRPAGVNPEETFGYSYIFLPKADVHESEEKEKYKK